MRSDSLITMRGRIVYVEDLNMGRMSVTNDIENVVDKVFEQVSINDIDGIIYRDSDGVFDAVIYDSNGKFKDFLLLGSVSNLQEAIKRYEELK